MQCFVVRSFQDTIHQCYTSFWVKTSALFLFVYHQTTHVHWIARTIRGSRRRRRGFTGHRHGCATSTTTTTTTSKFQYFERQSNPQTFSPHYHRAGHSRTVQLAANGHHFITLSTLHHTLHTTVSSSHHHHHHNHSATLAVAIPGEPKDPMARPTCKSHPRDRPELTSPDWPKVTSTRRRAQDNQKTDRS